MCFSALFLSLSVPCPFLFLMLSSTFSSQISFSFLFSFYSPAPVFLPWFLFLSFTFSFHPFSQCSIPCLFPSLHSFFLHFLFPGYFSFSISSPCILSPPLPCFSIYFPFPIFYWKWNVLVPLEKYFKYFKLPTNQLSSWRTGGKSSSVFIIRLESKIFHFQFSKVAITIKLQNNNLANSHAKANLAHAGIQCAK